MISLFDICCDLCWSDINDETYDVYQGEVE